MIFTIYQLLSPSNKSYIGQTKQEKGIDERFSQHVFLWKKWINEGRPRKSYQPKLFYAFDKYSPENFSKKILIDCNTQEEADQYERSFIEEYNAVSNGYNITKGGQGLRDLTLNEEHKNKISESRKEYFQTNDGLKWKEELSKKFKENNPCKKGNVPWNLNRKCPEISQGRKGISPTYSAAEHKRRKENIVKRSVKTYKIITPAKEEMIITNLSQFCRDHNLPNQHITGKYGYKGYHAYKV